MKNAVCFAERPVKVSSCYPCEENLTTKYLRSISSIPVLTADEEKELAKKIAGGDLEAKKLLAKSNLRLAANIAIKNSNCKVPLIDLIQEANVGLMVAIDKFNYKFGYKFSTYASWWIKQGVLKAISEQSNCVKIPVYIQETLAKYSKSVDKIKVKSPEMVESEKLREYVNAFKSSVSFDEPFEFSQNKQVSLIDVVADENINATLKAEEENLKKDLYKVLNQLESRESQVIKFRFGLDTYAKKTLDEIGKIYGVTKECIRQTELRALRKLKNLCVDYELSYYCHN